MIEVNDVFFDYPTGVRALNGVSVKIEDGEFLAIMGENGAGKTTLIKHFNGLLKPTRGKVLVDEVDTREQSVAELSRKIGIVFQNPDHQLFCETVKDEIAFGLKNFNFSDEAVSKRMLWALNLLDLSRYQNLSPFMLSGGERKRVAMASVLAWDPEVVVLDEPTIGQDYRQKERLRQFIVQLNSQGKTVVIVTHDVEFVVDCNPRVVLMSRGRIVADGPARQVLTDCNVLAEASIVLPQITQIFVKLEDLNLPIDVIDIYEARNILTRLVRGKLTHEGL